MELKTLSVAIATTLTSTGVFALSEPVSQVTEQHAHSAHTHGVESNRVEYQPTATLPIQPSKATRVQSLESLDESDRKSTRLNSSHTYQSRMPSSA